MNESQNVKELGNIACSLASGSDSTGMRGINCVVVCDILLLNNHLVEQGFKVLFNKYFRPCRSLVIFATTQLYHCSTKVAIENM